MSNMLNTPRVALITGSADPSGLGFEAARQLASVPHSHIVILSARKLADAQVAATVLRAKLGADVPEDHIQALALDVADPASIAAAVAEVRHKFDRLDVLINSAGLGLPRSFRKQFENEGKIGLKTETTTMADVEEVI